MTLNRFHFEILYHSRQNCTFITFVTVTLALAKNHFSDNAKLRKQNKSLVRQKIFMLHFIKGGN